MSILYPEKEADEATANRNSELDWSFLFQRIIGENSEHSDSNNRIRLSRVVSFLQNCQVLAGPHTEVLLVPLDWFVVLWTIRDWLCPRTHYLLMIWGISEIQSPDWAPAEVAPGRRAINCIVAGRGEVPGARLSGEVCVTWAVFGWPGLSLGSAQSQDSSPPREVK